MVYSEWFLVLAPLAYVRERFPCRVMVHTCSITGAVSEQGDDGRDAEGTIDPEDQSATRIVTRPSRPSRHVHVQVIPFSWMISLFITIPKEKNPSPIVPKFLPKDVAH